MNREFWRKRRVFVTGHTGFKGGWLALWLADMGAEVYGYALAPESDFGFYNITNLSKYIAGETLADIRNRPALTDAIGIAQPDIVLHLAAQPLVRVSYEDPVDTISVNVSGLITLFEVIRATDSISTIINVTTDKCYENREWDWPYREIEALGGHDLYSASKACAEILTASYRRSFFSSVGVEVATARAGNVIGGGDRAKDRLVPDILKTFDCMEPLILRNPTATRPWQHVLEPLSGYLTLAEAMAEKDCTYSGAWNFGPSAQDTCSVAEIADYLCGRIPNSRWELANETQPHEAQNLALDSSKARNRLGWKPKWGIESALSRTLDWHRAWRNGASMTKFTLSQIADYESV